MAFKIPVHRKSEAELNQAISDLEKRGFTLLAKKPVGHHRKYFDRDRDNVNKHTFSHSIEATSWKAIMVRKSRA